jgi:hypothetical protein
MGTFETIYIYIYIYIKRSVHNINRCIKKKGRKRRFYNFISIDKSFSMTRKYQCDYCNKKFPDTPQHKESHLKSFSHILQVRYYYDNLRQREGAIVKRPLPCKKYFMNERCDASSCRYSHGWEDRLPDLGDVVIRDWRFIPVHSDKMDREQEAFQIWQSLPIHWKKTFPPSMIYHKMEEKEDGQDAVWG